MARLAFYDSPEYKAKQSAITKRNQDLGLYKFNKKQESRICVRSGCGKIFTAQLHNVKKFCSQSCAGKVNNAGRVMSQAAKQKISQALVGRSHAAFVNPFKGKIKVRREQRVCQNQKCAKEFPAERWKKTRFCSVACAMHVVGSRPTSPKASRGKAGVRLDISPTIYFYSRWEANMARFYSYFGVAWEFSPKSFDIGGHTYTPDFYLSETNTYIEVKNFWGEYSRVRDENFRKVYPNLALKVILRDEYLKLEEKYAKLISNWEYKNSPF